MGTHRTHIIFHGKVTVRCTGTIPCMFLQIFHHQFLHVKREASACTKLGERHLVCIRHIHLFQPVLPILPVCLECDSKIDFLFQKQWPVAALHKESPYTDNQSLSSANDAGRPTILILFGSNGRKKATPNTHWAKSDNVSCIPALPMSVLPFPDYGFRFSRLPEILPYIQSHPYL